MDTLLEKYGIEYEVTKFGGFIHHRFKKKGKLFLICAGTEEEVNIQWLDAQLAQTFTIEKA